MAASPIAAALAAALALAPPALHRPVPTDRFIVTDTWDVALAPPAGPPAGATDEPVSTDSPALDAPGEPVPADSPSLEAPPALEVVAAARPGPVPADSATPEGPAPAPALDLGCHGSRPCQRLIALGSIAGGLGLAALASGAALLIRPVSVAPDDPTTVVTYRPAGAALLAIGTGLAATWLLTLLAARKASRLAQRAHASQAVP